MILVGGLFNLFGNLLRLIICEIFGCYMIKILK